MQNPLEQPTKRYPSKASRNEGETTPKFLGHRERPRSTTELVDPNQGVSSRSIAKRRIVNLDLGFKDFPKSGFVDRLCRFGTLHEIIAKHFGLFVMLRDRPRSITKRDFAATASSQKGLPMQGASKRSGVSGYFGLIRKQPETARNSNEQIFSQAEMNELFLLLGRNAFRDDCGRFFVPFPTLHLLRILYKNAD